MLRLQSKTSRLLNLNVSSIRAAEELELHVRETRYELDRFLLSGERIHLENALHQEAESLRWLREAEQLATTPEEQSHITQVRHGIDTFSVALRQAIPQPAPPRQIIEEVMKSILTDQVLPHARHYLDLNEAELEASSRQNQAMSQRLALALLLLGTCGAIAGLVAGYGVSRGISRSILQLSLPIRDVAGKLNEVVEPISISADPELDDLETILTLLSTEVSAVVEQLQARQREVLRADQLAALGQLAAGLAHELRNPLMCVKVLIQAALRLESKRLCERDIEVLDEEVSRMEQMLQGFLDFARPPKPQPKLVDLREIISHTVDFVSTRAAKQEIRLNVSIEPEPAIVAGDPTMLRQVLLNLLLNGLDAVSPRGWIAVSITESEHPSHGYVLRVTDNGRGLPPEHPDKIFEPFFSTKETGLGLGLAMCQRIVELHGGEIQAFAREGGGTVFSVWLPTPKAESMSAVMNPVELVN